MSEMVRRVAERIDDELKLYRQGLDWQDADGPIQRATRAAIEAMKGPTDEMIDAAYEWTTDSPIDIWNHMIDAALTESIPTSSHPPQT